MTTTKLTIDESLARVRLAVNYEMEEGIASDKKEQAALEAAYTHVSRTLNVGSLALTNAVKIAFEFAAAQHSLHAHFELAPEMVEQIEGAALAVAQIEYEADHPDFWGDGHVTDWETTCFKIAHELAEGREPTVKAIRGIIFG